MKVAKLNEKQKDISKKISHLIQYQDISRDLDNLVEEINGMKEDMLKEEKKYQAKQMQHDKHIPLLEKTQKEYDQIKKELDAVKKQVDDDEEKKKKIKTIREFKAINKQIDEHNRKNAILENNLLTKSEELEFKTEKVNLIRETMKELEDFIKAKKEDLEALIKERKEAINELTEKKNAVEQKLPPKLVFVFNRIYKHKDKAAVVKVYHQECHGCHMKVPFQTEVDVRKQQEIVYCTNCSRILYWEDSKDE